MAKKGYSLAVTMKKPRTRKRWKFLRVEEDTHTRYKIRAAEEGCKIHELADRLVKTK